MRNRPPFQSTQLYNGLNLVASHIEAPGTAEAATESFTYDLRGRRLTHTDFAGKVWTTHYDDCCGQTVSSENPLGHGTINRSNPLSRPVHQITVADFTDHITSLDNPINAKTYREVTVKYDGRGRSVARTTWLVARGAVDVSNPPIAGLASVPAGDGLTELFLYDDNLADGVGLDSSTGLAPIISALGNVSLATALAKLADTPANGGAEIEFIEGAAGSARVSISPAGDVSFSIADAIGRTVMSGTIKPPGGPGAGDLISWSCTQHDNTSALAGFGTVLETRSIDALGNVSKSLTDGAGRTLRSIDALGKITSFTFDAAGNQLSVRDPNNVGQDCVYDALGRDTSCTDTASVVTSSAYDREGNRISSTDGKSKTTIYAFDARGRQVTQTDRISGVTTFTYTPTGQLASLKDAQNQTTSYTYDNAGVKLTETYPDHTGGTPGSATYGIVTFVPDPTGRTLRRQDQNGDTVTYVYDLAGRLTKRDYRVRTQSPSGTIANSDTFTYDKSSRMLTAVSGRYTNTVAYTYDRGGRKATEALTISGKTYTATTTYDPAGRVATLTYPNASVVTRAYTPRGQLHTLKVGSTTIDTRAYDDGGRMTASAYNNGVSESRAYANDNTLTSISFTGAPIGNLSYGWDANKNKTSETIGGTMSGYGFAVGGSGYDDEDRLVNWQRSDSNLNQSWNLSLVGDWNSITTNGTPQSRTHGPAHEMLTAAGQNVTRDVKGNTTLIPAVLRPSGSVQLKLKWDFDNRLSAADSNNDNTDDVFYRFDALGRRVARNDGTNHTIFFQDGQQTIADYPAGAAPASPTYTYIYASYIDEPVMRSGTGGLRYYHRNQQYSIAALTDGSGAIAERYAYSAYGQVTFANAAGTPQTASASNNRYTYTGREWDPGLKLYHYRARMYDPIGGRFISRDPIGYVDGQSLYRAYFVIASTDPTGAVTCAMTGRSIGAPSQITAVAGGVSASVGGGTNPSPHSFQHVSSVTCQRSRTVTFTYSCICYTCLLGVKNHTTTETLKQTASDDLIPVPGGVVLITAGVSVGPATGAASVSAWMIHPDDQIRANDACNSKGLVKPSFSTYPPAAPTKKFNCPGVPFH